VASDADAGDGSLSGANNRNESDRRMEQSNDMQLIMHSNTGMGT
jgi:hypothetical protein